MMELYITNFINLFGYPTLDGIELNDNNDIYKLFKLTECEISHIETILN